MDLGFLSSGEFHSTVCALLWASAVILFRKSGEHVPPVALNLYKGLVGLVLTLATMAILGIPFSPPDVTSSDWIILFLSGLVGIGVADTLFFRALNNLGAARLAIVDCLYSPFVMLCSFIYLSEPVGPGLILAMVLMVLAIALGAYTPGTAILPGPERSRLRAGVLLAILSVFLMAAAIVVVKPILNRSDVWWAISIRLAGGVAYLSVQGMLPAHRAGVLRVLRPGPLWKLIFPAAFVGTYLAIFFWTLGMKLTYTTTASVLNQLSNVFILPLAAIFLKEHLGPRQVVAIALGFLAGLLAVL